MRPLVALLLTAIVATGCGGPVSSLSASYRRELPIADLDRWSSLGQSVHVSLHDGGAADRAVELGLGRPGDMVVYRCPATALQDYTHLALDVEHLQGSPGVLEVTLGATSEGRYVLSPQTLPVVDSSTRQLVLALPPPERTGQETIDRLRFRLVEGREVFFRLTNLALVRLER